MNPSDAEVGEWFQARWRVRLIRRVVFALPTPLPRVIARGVALLPSEEGSRIANDLAFWSRVRASTDPSEWAWLTRNSYVALCYHRITDDRASGQERMNVPPRVFRRQLRLLQLLRYRPLSADEVVAFHERRAPIGRRRYALTADDGFVDCVSEMGAAGARPQLFVPSAAPGLLAWWTPGGEVADWPQLTAAVTAGAAIGSHGRRHVPLVDLSDDELHRELAGSRSDLQERFPQPCQLLAYPNGRYDDRVRQAAIDTGYDAAYTTDPGRNGPAMDLWSLRRVTPKAWDSRLSFLFRVITGEPISFRWDARRQLAFERSRGAGFSAGALRGRAEAQAHRLTRMMSPGRRYRSAIIADELDHRVTDHASVTLLDAGCEDGIVATRIAQRHPNWLIIGTDLNLDALRYGKRWAAEHGARNVHFTRGDITKLLRDDEFDAAIAVDCLTEVPDDRAALEAIARALRPGGVLVVHVPIDGWEPVLASSGRFWPRAVRRGYTPDELTQKMTAAGLVVDDVRLTFRSLGHLAQEMRDRFVKPRRLLVQVAAFPLLVGAVRLERAGITWGPPRELLVSAHRPER